MADFLANDMARQSAFAALSAQALTVSLPVGAGAIKIPARTSPADAGRRLDWRRRGENGLPRQLSCNDFDAEQVGLPQLHLPRKCSTSTEIETILREVLAHDLTALLDQTLLDATASSATRPAGLWNGATAVTASAATPPSEAMMVDLKALHAAVATNNPDANVVVHHQPGAGVAYQYHRAGIRQRNRQRIPDRRKRRRG